MTPLQVASITQGGRDDLATRKERGMTRKRDTRPTLPHLTHELPTTRARLLATERRAPKRSGKVWHNATVRTACHGVFWYATARTEDTRHDIDCACANVVRARRDGDAEGIDGGEERKIWLQ